MQKQNKRTNRNNSTVIENDKTLNKTICATKKLSKPQKIAIAVTVFIVVFLALDILGVWLISQNYNELYNHPRNINGVVDFSGYDSKDFTSTVNLAGDFEFFYNKWIVTDGFEGAPDTIVSVPHRWTGMTIDGQKLDNKGYASYRFYITGLPVGTEFILRLDNFVGAYRSYVNGQVSCVYGEATKTGNAGSNGMIDNEYFYKVVDDKPLEAVFEVSSFYDCGLHAVPWISFESNPTLYWTVRTIGVFGLGMIVALFIVTLIINLGLRKEERQWTFSIVMAIYAVEYFFSVDVYWLMCHMLDNYAFNIVLEVNYVIGIMLAICTVVHLKRCNTVNFNAKWYISFGVIFALCTVAYYALIGTSWRIIPIIIEAFASCAIVYPLAIGAAKGNKYNIIYIILFFFNLLAVLCASFDFLDVLTFGLDVVASVGLIINAVLIISMDFLIVSSNSIRAMNALRLEDENRRIKSDTLRSQIKPHFIFNSLTNIQNLYNKDLRSGNLALTKFSKHLRANVEAAVKDIVSFQTELENIMNYVDLENMRREHEVNLLLDCEVYDFEVPVLSLQPFIENSFKYSEVDEKDDGFIEIKSYETVNEIVVEVNDNGIGFDMATVKPTSTGLKNATERLKLMSKANAQVDSVIGEGTRIRINFPKQKQNDEENE